MSLPLDTFRTWLDTVTGVATPLRVTVGWWQDYDESKADKYLTYAVVGGSAPREVDTRMIHISLTIAGAKHATYDTIAPLANAILAKTQEIPPQCDIVAVNMLGEVIGPAQSNGGRPLLTMTLQLIM